MILELERMTADWLDDATYGVNAQLATIPLDAGDSAPTDIAGVHDITRSKNVAQRKDPPNYPAIYVMADGAFEMEGEIMTNAGPRRTLSVPIAVRVLVAEGDLEDGNRDARYYVRAIIKSMKALTEATPVLRTRNSICLERIVSITHDPTVAETLGESIVAGALVFTLEVRDGATT